MSTTGGAQETPPSLKHFGPLLDIKEESLLGLAMQIRKDVLKQNTTEARLLPRIEGEYNLIHIIQLDDLKLVIRVPAYHGSSLDSNAVRAVKATVDTLNFLEKNTTVPAPRIYQCDITADNVLRAPYICMTYIEGESLMTSWNDGALEPEALELRRQTTLMSIAEAMAQLARFRFDRIGSLKDVGGRFEVGQAYELHCDDGVGAKAMPYGPHNSWAEYIKENMVPSEMSEASDYWAKGKTKMIEAMLSFMPCADDTGDFVLSLPSEEISNYLVDADGALTGIIDWDGAITLPACIGYASFPSFITRDWDPIRYQLPALNLEASVPIRSENYREHYDQAMRTALKGHADWKWVAKSHIRQAVYLAAIDDDCRKDVCRKFVEEVTGIAEGEGELANIGMGMYGDDEWEDLKMGLEQLIREN